MLLLTWNLNKKVRALAAVLDHLASLSESFLAVFQELPRAASSTASATTEAMRFGKGKIACVGVVGSKRQPGRLGLFSSPDVKVTQPITMDSGERLAIVEVDVAGRVTLRLVGLHARDRRNVPHEDTRTVLAARARDTIEAQWKPKQPLILMGDFNADPYHTEVRSRHAMFALRDRLEVERTWEPTKLLTSTRPLYNPMWHLLPETTTRPPGSYLLKSGHDGFRWRLCDQILVSQELIGSIAGPPEILDALGTTALTSKQGYPSGKLSDHLPVQLRISI